ncbi:MAG: histone deacetylase family protein [Candidatus Aminicenantes bacterium]|nr:histone deacetylase family protein [Candidatus Aminicenantes bacterium]
MFRIRKIQDYHTPDNRKALDQMLAILRSHFTAVKPEKIQRIVRRMENPIPSRLQTIVFVAEDADDKVKGFAILLVAPDLGFSFLDFIATRKGILAGGIGSAIYERVREEAEETGSIGLFFECLPDDPLLCPKPKLQKENAARLRFYEKFGARPVVGTKYETPVKEGDVCPPYLVFDDLGHGQPLCRDRAREIVRAILQRLYADYCPDEYIQMVVDSLQDDPLRLRPPRYSRKSPASVETALRLKNRRVMLLVSEGHHIHHVRERGYVESPVRIDSILAEAGKSGLFARIPSEHYPEKYIREVHIAPLVNFIKRVSREIDPGSSLYPYVFPVRLADRPPKEFWVAAGYYCIDTFTPLSRYTFQAAQRAVDCALTGADRLLQGDPLAYALVRPPGHHAESRVFGGFCYFNSAAVAAQYLSRFGRVAILDLDYHHGNGQQEIFYRRKDVLTISLHADPSFAYPYFSGFRNEKGEGEGTGTNLNIPLPEKLGGTEYRMALKKALKRVADFRPEFLIIPFGADTARGDPTGTWSLKVSDFHAQGMLIGAMPLPKLVVQEGGYRTRQLGVNVVAFFEGLLQGRNHR